MKKNENLQNPVNPCYDSITVEGGGKPSLLKAFSRFGLLKKFNTLPLPSLSPAVTSLPLNGCCGRDKRLKHVIPLHNGARETVKTAFTLAEVLITLGIIGIVAALTIPTLVQAYNKRIVETRLKHFYVTINQAVRLSEAEYGPFEGWNSMIDSSDADGMEKWWNTYFAPHIKTLKIKKGKNNDIKVYLYDGSKCEIFVYFGGSNTSRSIHLYFYPKANNKTAIMGKDSFTFFINAKINKKYLPVEPYKFNWDGTESSLKFGTYGCYSNPTYPHYCTALIQYNNWKIPDDYPYKF